MEWKEEVVQEGSKARLGRLVDKRTASSFETPLYIVYTRKGGVPAITNDILEEIAPKAPVQLCIFDIFEQGGVKTIESFQKYCQQEQEKTPTPKSFLFQRFMHLEGHPIFLSIRDPQYNANLAFAGDKHVAFDAMSGRVKIDTNEYVEAIKNLEPHMFVSMCDEAGAYASAGKKRAQKTVSRSNAWLKSMKLDKEVSSMFAAIEGITDMKSRKESIKEAVSNPNTFGFLFGGLAGGETPEERFAILKECIADLPNDKPRMISGQDSPCEVLACVELGIDSFDGTYPFTMAEFGYASVFPILFDEHVNNSNSNSNINGSNNNNNNNNNSDNGATQAQSVYCTKLNLRDPQYRIDKRPILEGCTCRTCRMHTRAYIHHLLNTQEMLYEVLLSIHNFHHYMRFFEQIRESIRRGKFNEYKAAFTRAFHSIQLQQQQHHQQS